MDTVREAEQVRLTNHVIAATLFNIATMLDMAQDTIYRVRAYRRAARRVLSLDEEAVDIVARGDELDLPGVGKRIRGKLGELLATGRLARYDDLVADQPEYVQSLMAVDGIGPKLARQLHDGLGICTPADLVARAEQNHLQQLYGFGPKREAALASAAREVVSLLAEAA